LDAKGLLAKIAIEGATLSFAARAKSPEPKVLTSPITQIQSR